MAGDDTMFIITGDHGMREDGNHGGGSRSQVQSLMLAYYKPITRKQQNGGNEQNEQQQQQQDYRLRYDNNIKQTQIHQIDITSTLSILLNIPNPINSISYPIIQILPSRFKQKLPNIQLNTLSQYKQILSHYNKQNQQQDQTNQCIENITKYMKSQLLSKSRINGLQDYEIFKKSIKNKLFVKQNIQQSECIIKKLSMNLPQYRNIWFGIVFMGIGLISLVIHILYEDIKDICRQNSPDNITMTIFINISLQHLSLILSLFSIYFSWYLIRNQSSYLLIIIISYITLFTNRSSLSSFKTFSLKFSLIILLIILTQLQPVKINQYQLNFMNLQLGKYFQSFLLSIMNHVGQQQQIYAFRSTQVGKRLFDKSLLEHIEIVVVNVWVMVKVLGIIKNLKIIRYKKKSNNNNNQNNYNNKVELSSKKNKLFMQLVMIILMYLNLVLSSFMDIKQNNFIYYLRYLLILLSIAYYINYDKTTKEQRYPFNQSQSSLIICLFSPFFTISDILHLIIFIKLIYKCLQLSNKLSSSDNNNNSFILISLVCQYYWWILGNRYQYSSIDIKRSYILSGEFNIVRNGAVMMMWFLLPYIVVVWVVGKNKQYYYENIHLIKQINQQLNLSSTQSNNNNNNNNNNNKS